jgi:hypothetical protein
MSPLDRIVAMQTSGIVGFYVGAASIAVFVAETARRSAGCRS